MGIRYRVLRATTGALLLFVGCSSESTNTGSGGAGGSGGTPAACSPLCDAIDSVKCPGESKLACLAQCTGTTQDCPALTEEFSTCVQQHKAEMTCDTDGDAVFKGCESLWKQILPCAICLAKPDDTTAQACLKAKCCGQLKAAYSRTDALDYLACLDQCGPSDTCAANCDTSFPEAAAKFAEIPACGSASGCGDG
ncbi:MAG: hypothetical protein IPM35_23635 [Myxococcales bacterium]|nr:hypothetical protein [Myxococcales bacterium]